MFLVMRPGRWSTAAGVNQQHLVDEGLGGGIPVVADG
jgi:hypothetical protein